MLFLLKITIILFISHSVILVLFILNIEYSITIFRRQQTTIGGFSEINNHRKISFFGSEALIHYISMIEPKVILQYNVKERK